MRAAIVLLSLALIATTVLAMRLATAQSTSSVHVVPCGAYLDPGCVHARKLC
jgi:hypothetical protein